MKSITLEEVLQLPVPERIRIVGAIRDSIADAPEAPSCPSKRPNSTADSKALK